MKFSIGEYVIVLRGEHKFKKVKILQHGVLGGVIDVYDVELPKGDDPNEPSVAAINIIEEDLRSLNPEDNGTSAYFNIEKYLTNNQREEIAKDVFKRRIEDKIQDVLQARKGTGQWIDLIFSEVANRWIEQLSDQFSNDFIEKIKKVISEDGNPKLEIGEYDETFLGSIRYKLSSITDKWIDEHRDEVDGWIRPNLKTFVERLSEDGVPKGISNKIDRIISSTLQQVIHDIYKDGINIEIERNK